MLDIHSLDLRLLCHAFCMFMFNIETERLEAINCQAILPWEIIAIKLNTASIFNLMCSLAYGILDSFLATARSVFLRKAVPLLVGEL